MYMFYAYIFPSKTPHPKGNTLCCSYVMFI